MKRTINNLQVTINQKKSKVTCQRSHVRSGQILIVGIIFMTVILILSAALFSRVTNYIRFNSNDITREQATNLAEAGLEKALWQLNQTAGSYTGETGTALGTTGTFEVAITNKSSNLKTITSTGHVPNKANPRAKRTIKVDVNLSNEQISFRYAVQVGTGGLTMANSSKIVGNVYSNKSGESITGSGTSSIQGDAYAVGTVSSPDPSITGIKRENQPASDMPTINYQEWIDAATLDGSNTQICSPTCNISSNTSIGPKKYAGNLTISNNATVTITGPIYVTGNLIISQGGTQIKLDEGFESSSTTLLVDGTIAISQGATFNTTSANPKGYILVATRSTSPTAVSLENQGVNAIVYALQGGASLSQTAHTTSLVANSLSLSQSASLTYDQGLAGAQFSTGPGGSWTIKKGTYRFTQ